MHAGALCRYLPKDIAICVAHIADKQKWFSEILFKHGIQNSI